MLREMIIPSPTITEKKHSETKWPQETTLSGTKLYPPEDAWSIL